MENKPTRPGAILAPIALAAALALLVTGGVWLLAGRRPGPGALRADSALKPRTVSLFTAGEEISVPAPESAPAPLPGEEEPYGYEEILAEEDGLLVARILGKRYRGFIAVIDDPQRLRVGICGPFAQGGHGKRVAEMADAAGAVLAVNGGAFADPGGVGNGNIPVGNVVCDGEILWSGWEPTVGMDADGVLHAGEFGYDGCVERQLRWALSYGPTLIENGQIRPGLDTYMQEPRTAVGQRADGSIVLLNIQGRQAAALGVSCQELAEIMAGYGCVTAGNLDGGASSDMYYRGEYINICNTSGGPRPIPTCLLVMPAEEGGEEP